MKRVEKLEKKHKSKRALKTTLLLLVVVFIVVGLVIYFIASQTVTRYDGDFELINYKTQAKYEENKTLAEIKADGAKGAIIVNDEYQTSLENKATSDNLYSLYLWDENELSSLHDDLQNIYDVVETVTDDNVFALYNVESNSLKIKSRFSNDIFVKEQTLVVSKTFEYFMLYQNVMTISKKYVISKLPSIIEKIDEAKNDVNKLFYLPLQNSYSTDGSLFYSTQKYISLNTSIDKLTNLDFSYTLSYLGNSIYSI